MMMMISQPEKNIIKLDIVRVLTRDKASPAHLRGRRPPSLVSDQRHPHSQHQQLSLPLSTSVNNHGDVHRVIATRSLSWNKLSNRSPWAKSLIKVRRLIRANSMMRVRVILSNIWTLHQNTKEGTWHSQSIWTMRSFHKVLNRPKVTNEAPNHLHGRVRLLNEVFSKKLRQLWQR